MTGLRIFGFMFIIFLFLVMALILYFLFSPITYSLDIRLYEKKRIVFRLGDVLRLFSLRFVREDENVFTIELFFGLIKIHPKKKKKEGEEKEEEKNEEEAEKEKTIKVAEKKEKSKKLKKLFEDKEAFKAVLKKIMKLLKKIFPHIRYADLDFALQSPDKTGTITGVMSLVPMLYGRHISFRPDFTAEKAYARGKVVLSGKIFLFYALYIIISLFTDDRTKKFMKALIAFLKESKKSKKKK